MKVISINEARRLASKDVVVLVSERNLEELDCNVAFTRKLFGECDGILQKAAIIAKIQDEISTQLWVFSEHQKDILNYEPKGELGTILFSNVSLVS